MPYKSTAEEVSFEWSHHKILSTDSKVRTALHVSIIDSWSEMVNPLVTESNLSTQCVHVYVNGYLLYILSMISMFNFSVGGRRGKK